MGLRLPSMLAGLAQPCHSVQHSMRHQQPLECLTLKKVSRTQTTTWCANHRSAEAQGNPHACIRRRNLFVSACPDAPPAPNHWHPVVRSKCASPAHWHPEPIGRGANIGQGQYQQGRLEARGMRLSVCVATGGPPVAVSGMGLSP